MRLSQSYNPNHGLGRLFCFQFYLSILGRLRIRFIIYFCLCSMRSFDLMTRVMSLIDWLMLSRVVFCVPFLIDFFIHPLIFGWLELELHDFLQFIFYGVILISWFSIDKLIRIDLTCFFSWIYIYIYIYMITRSVQASLRAPRLIPKLTEHPTSPVGR